MSDTPFISPIPEALWEVLPAAIGGRETSLS
jgi:hypothetical protein